MRILKPQFITDDKGKKISVVIPIDEYKIILDELEELEDIRLYDNAKSVGDSSLPIDEAFDLIESKRRSKK